MADPGATPEHDPTALDALERRFWGEIWAAADPTAVAAHGIAIERFGPVQATAIEDLPQAGMLNLVLGAGEARRGRGRPSGGGRRVGRLARRRLLRACHAGTARQRARPSAGSTSNGFERGYAWMKFVRDASRPDFPEPEASR